MRTAFKATLPFFLSLSFSSCPLMIPKTMQFVKCGDLRQVLIGKIPPKETRELKTPVNSEGLRLTRSAGKQWLGVTLPCVRKRAPPGSPLPSSQVNGAGGGGGRWEAGLGETGGVQLVQHRRAEKHRVFRWQGRRGVGGRHRTSGWPPRRRVTAVGELGRPHNFASFSSVDDGEQEDLIETVLELL